MVKGRGGMRSILLEGVHRAGDDGLGIGYLYGILLTSTGPVAIGALAKNLDWEDNTVTAFRTSILDRPSRIPNMVSLPDPASGAASISSRVFDPNTLYTTRRKGLFARLLYLLYCSCKFD